MNNFVKSNDIAMIILTMLFPTSKWQRADRHGPAGNHAWTFEGPDDHPWVGGGRRPRCQSGAESSPSGAAHLMRK